jgi:hypothetical protein
MFGMPHLTAARQIDNALTETPLTRDYLKFH